jgi:CRISPR-associated helicase cas3
MMARKKVSVETPSVLAVVTAPVFPAARSDLDASELSDLARCFWAKTGAGAGAWLSVVQHLMDAADIAGNLFDGYLSEHHRQLMASVWDGDQSKARASFVFLAGVHDAGKVSPQFACQSAELAELIRDQGISVMRKKDYAERAFLPHGLVSQFALQEVVAAGGGDPRRARQWAILVGIHHGRYPDSDAVRVAHQQYKYQEGSVTDEPRWGQARAEILRWMAARSGFPLIAPGTALPELPIAVASAYASALVIADWLASNEEYFPLRPRPINGDRKLSIEGYPELTAEQQRARVERAWKRAAFPSPMRLPEAPTDEIADFYRHRFGWPASYRPTCAQREAVEIASTEDPDLMIVEAPPGSGKTELAFAAAELLMRARGLQGVFVALPTQATTNAMFERVTAWLTSILGDEPQKLGIQLAHGKNSLNESFMKLLESGKSPLEVYDDEGDLGLHASRWMGQRWRSTLSPVVVGTIDQVLLAALKSRHVLVRHLGLMGKVVVIDEVHAADEYMETYLEAALTWLGMYGIPVVLLSATLPPARRRALLDAYRRGRGSSGEGAESVEGVIGYPVISTLSAAGVHVHEITGEAEAPKRIIPTSLGSPDEIAELLDCELVDGGCAVVIRNTVREAQETYDAVKAVFGREQTTLLHSRFLAAERTSRDRRMLELFVKGATRRPQRHVVVATQVIEQSLDVDFDLMLTDPAPMDLILQRIGRLHRHERADRPVGLREARCLVVVEDLFAVPWAYSTGTDHVYSRHAVLRTLGILSDRGEITVREPIDYAQLTALAYSDVETVGPSQWADAFDTALDERKRSTAQSRMRASTWCLDGMNVHRWKAPKLEEKFQGNAATGEDTKGPGVAAARAAVRDGEDQIPVLVVAIDPELGNVPVPPPLTGRATDDEKLEVSEYNARGHIADICSWSISLPPWAFRARGQSVDQAVDAVAGAIWDDPITAEWACREHPFLAGELILAMYKTPGSERLMRDLCGHTITYSTERGMEVQGQ